MTATFGQIVLYTMVLEDDPTYAGYVVPAVVCATYDQPSENVQPSSPDLVHLTSLATTQFAFAAGTLMTDVAEGTGPGTYQVIA